MRQTKVGKLESILQYETTVQKALGFILAFEEVSTVIPGAKTVAQLIGNLSASGSRMSYEEVQKVKQFWKEELEMNPLGW